MRRRRALTSGAPGGGDAAPGVWTVGVTRATVALASAAPAAALPRTAISVTDGRANARMKPCPSSMLLTIVRSSPPIGPNWTKWPPAFENVEAGKLPRPSTVWT